MFFLIEKTDKEKGELKIVSNFKHAEHYSRVVLVYLNTHNIDLIENFDEVKKSGVYCKKNNKNLYEIFEVEYYEPGYILNEYTTAELVYSLHIVSYELTPDKFYQIYEDIKYYDL